jgi:hypothetical protein
MDELIKQVSQKAGITPDQAKIAITQVIEFLKQKLPAPIAQQIDGVLGGGGMPDLSKDLPIGRIRNAPPLTEKPEEPPIGRIRNVPPKKD